MQTDLRAFWHRFQTGIEVAIASSTPEELLGVRDGFLRYFHEGLERHLAVAVVPHPPQPSATGLPSSDEEMVQRARRAAAKLQGELGSTYHFYVASEGGLHSLEVEGTSRFFVRSWTAVMSPVGEALGSSGSVEIPGRLLSGVADEQIPLAIPGTRRRGGMLSSLTGGLETRRSAARTSTVHALSSLFYGVLGRGAGREH